MTGEDAAVLAPLIAQVDGGCSVCVRSMVSRLTELWPDHDWPALVARHYYGDPEDLEVDV